MRPRTAPGSHERSPWKSGALLLYGLFGLSVLFQAIGCARQKSACFVIGDASTVGATFLVNGQTVGTLSVRVWERPFDPAGPVNPAKQLEAYRRWLAHRDSTDLGVRGEFRVHNGKLKRVEVDARGREKLSSMTSMADMMELDSVVVHYQWPACLPTYPSHVMLVSTRGETLTVDIHPHSYNAITASFAQHRIQAESMWDMW